MPDNLSSPNASTASRSVFALAAIVAHEGRSTLAMGIGKAFFNADITNTGVKVHIRLNRTLTSMIV